MGAVGKFIHTSDHAVNIACTDTYSTARRHLIDVMEDTYIPTKRYKLGTLYLHVDTIAGAPTGITVRLCRDAAGNQPVIGDTTATLSLGVTTATEGNVTIKIDSVYAHTDTNLYIFFKTNVAASTCNVRTIELTSEE
jgi:hypothetical protein